MSVLRALLASSILALTCVSTLLTACDAEEPVPSKDPADDDPAEVFIPPPRQGGSSSSGSSSSSSSGGSSSGTPNGSTLQACNFGTDFQTLAAKLSEIRKGAPCDTTCKPATHCCFKLGGGGLPNFDAGILPDGTCVSK